MNSESKEILEKANGLSDEVKKLEAAELIVKDLKASDIFEDPSDALSEIHDKNIRAYRMMMDEDIRRLTLDVSCEIDLLINADVIMEENCSNCDRHQPHQ